MSTITKNINEAIIELNAGNLVAIPTETVYGLAGNAEDEEAILKIFALKNRPINHPLIMHVAKDCDLTRWVTSIPPYAQKLIDTFWPGPLTVVLNCQPNAVNPLITGGQNTVAIRCPKHPIAQSLMQALNFPLVAPSANPFGKISPTTALHVQQSFSQQRLLILDGGRCEIGIESTIIDATSPTHYQILRHGLIDEQSIQTTIAIETAKSESNIRVSGRLLTHYQPEKPLYCFRTAKELNRLLDLYPNAYIFSFNENSNLDKTHYYQFSLSPSEVAYELYYQLRNADNSPASTILVELPPSGRSWAGITERLLKMVNHSANGLKIE
ncbi:L-threonylcarbamoyladenylate synthase [Legionella gresilensis]|uniref:L-threonylcarbamoyladenylate synthase n=1 Tax=Legionella gresilensis TaxID=91823 RepID=UPI001041467A|nr:L-threonylcarbamoyladenylate synthase [Legionella gresilensis]